jgi:predicted Zn-dependent protease
MRALLILLLSLSLNAEIDAILESMNAELERSTGIQLQDLEKPYFIEYSLDDVHSFSVSATLGAVLARTTNHFRLPRVSVRLGSYEFDNTNYILSGFMSRGPGAAAPLDDSVPALRTTFWLATDSAYKGALEAIARKRAALKNMTPEELEDFWRVEPSKVLLNITPRKPDEKYWTGQVRELSTVVGDAPAVLASHVSFEDVRAVAYLANTEGTRVRCPDNLICIRIRAEGQAGDGMMIRDGAALQWLDDSARPAETELRKHAQRVAANVEAIAQSPVADNYTGPVLVEREAAAQLLAQLLGSNLVAARRPVGEPGRPLPFQPSEFAGRIGTRVLPEWIDVVDDPTATQWRGRPLFGHYTVDMEGVAPKPLKLVEKGILKDFLLTRQPVKGRSGTNGRARLPGRFGANVAAFSNLFVTAGQSKTSAELRQQLVDLCRQRELLFGIVIRKLDFPYTGELERMRDPGARMISPPVLVYRLYPDGKEELVRGLRFRGASSRLLRDIVAVSDESWLFDFVANAAPMAMMGAGGYVTASAVVAPSLLFEDMELERSEQELPRRPVVPPPQVVRSPRSAAGLRR